MAANKQVLVMKPVIFRVNEEDKAFLDRVADAHGWSQQDLAEWAVKLYALALRCQQNSVVENEFDDTLDRLLKSDRAERFRLQLVKDEKMLSDFFQVVRDRKSS